MTDIQRIYPVVIFLSLIMACGFLAGCTASSPQPAAAPSASPSPPFVTARANSTFERVEVFHFHGNRQCASCIAVGNLAERTVNASFGTELESGRLVFAHVNYDQPENAALATNYNVTGSSLWIGVYDVNGFHKEQDLRVWSLINDGDAYSTYLSGIITRRLNGDLS